MVDRVSIWRRFDYLLFAATVVLVIFGILMIDSATQDAIDDDIISRVPDQINFALIGFTVVIIFAAIDYRLLGGISAWLYAGMVILLILVQVFGVEGAGGAKRWLNVGIRIQPSEIGKIIMIITLSQHIAERYLDLGKLSTVFGTMLHAAIPTALIFVQPDLGTTIVFFVIWAVIIWSAGLRLRHIALFLSAGLLILIVVFPLLRPYQRARVETFLSPDVNSDEYYNIDQALISIGSGGVLGKGYYVGSQNTGRFLRVSPYRFYLQRNRSRVWHGRRRRPLGRVYPGSFAHFEGRPRSERPARLYDLLRRGRHDLLSDDGVHWYES